MRRKSVAVLVAALVGCPSDNRPVDLLLTNARVIVGDGTVIDRGTLVIDAGRIVAVHDGSQTNRKALRTMDLAGHTLLPGLIDTHVHLLLGDANPQGSMPLSDAALSEYLKKGLQAKLRDYLARGVTTVLSTGDYYPEILRVRQETADSAASGPRVLAAGPVFCKAGGHPASTICGGNAWCAKRLTRELRSVTDVDSAIGEMAAAKVDMLKLVHDAGLAASALPAELLQSAIAGGHAHQIWTLVHAGSVKELLAAKTAGADRFAHPPWFDTLQAGDFTRVPPREFYVSTTLAISSISDDWERAAGRPPRYLANVIANVRQLHQSGATIAFGTDVPMLSVVESLDLELRLLKEAGYTPEEIIRMATINAATYLGLRNDIGTIEPGKRADVLVLRSNPLQNLNALRDVALVLRAGKVVFTRESSHLGK